MVLTNRWRSRHQSRSINYISWSIDKYLEENCTLWRCKSVVGVDKIILTMVKALHRGFGDSPEICRPATMTLCPWRLTFWTHNQQASTNGRELLSCQVSSHSDQGISFYRTNIRIHTHTHIETTVPVRRLTINGNIAIVVRFICSVSK